jgi:mono/diheme cytochrome c family protein/YHS domain-containing protein
MIVMLVLLEFFALARREALPRAVTVPLVSLTALSAVFAAVTGWLLSREGYSGETVVDHRNLGIGVAVASALFALAHRTERVGAYRLLLLVAAGLLLPTGHLGASMTHGRGFLTEPLRRTDPGAERRRPEPVESATDEPEPATVASEPVADLDPPDPEPAAPLPSTYETVIAPIFAASCNACHGPDKQKGKLALHTAALIEKGGYGGPILAPGDLEGSELWYRVSRPMDDEDRMPPEGKPQLSAAALRQLEAWILAGAPFEGQVDLDAVPLPVGPPATTPEPATEQPARLDPPDGDALAALERELVHVERLDPKTGELWIDFSAIAAETDDELAVRLLEPLAGHVAHLNLSRTRVGAATIELCARMPRLARLDLRATTVGDAELAALAGHATLAELVLAQTALTDDALDSLLALPALRRVFLWRAGFSADGLARLAAERPLLSIVDGEAAPAAVLEEEPEITLKKPLPEGEPSALAPINATCPVSGSPVDAAFRVVHEGRVIGFCCPNCPKTFWDDPAAFAAKLE